MADILHILVDAFVANSSVTAATPNDRLDGTVAETIARFGEPNANLDNAGGAVPRHRGTAIQEVTSWA